MANHSEESTAVIHLSNMRSENCNTKPQQILETIPIERGRDVFSMHFNFIPVFGFVSGYGTAQYVKFC